MAFDIEKEVRETFPCRCDVAWTGRDRHCPDNPCYWWDDIIDFARRCHDAAVEETEQICGADKKRLNWLESVETGYGEGWVCRISTTGRGWRLHETGRHDGIEPSDVRGAVDNARCEYERRRAREEEW